MRRQCTGFHNSTTNLFFRRDIAMKNESLSSLGGGIGKVTEYLGRKFGDKPSSPVVKAAKKVSPSECRYSALCHSREKAGGKRLRRPPIFFKFRLTYSRSFNYPTLLTGSERISPSGHIASSD